MPPEIIDSIESVVQIFFSAVAHRDRAAFILCDNLVEMACKTKSIQLNHRYNTQVGFFDAVDAHNAVLPQPLRDRLQGYRTTRNNLQHVGAALTVDSQHCADAISDAVDTINMLWPGVPVHQQRPRLATGLRIIPLLCSNGDPVQREDFVDAMLRFRWRTNDREQVEADATQIRPGQRENWNYSLLRRRPDVERLLDDLGISTL